MKLNQKVALITGSTQGIGLGIATAFAKEGAFIALNDLKSPQQVAQIHHELKSVHSQSMYIKADVTNEQQVKEMVNDVVNEFGRIDILVNNAGMLHYAPLHQMDVAEWDRIIDTNLRSVFLCTRFVAPLMIKQRFGRIINISSQHGQKGRAELAHYSAAKAGVIGFTKALARELGKYNITVNCIAPGIVKTDMLLGRDSEWEEKRKAQLPLPRIGLVEEVAPSAVLLASDPDGNLYTGQTLGPCAGDVMY